MATTPILGITEVVPDQNGKFDTINAMFVAVENSVEDTQTHSLASGDVAVNAADFSAYQVHKTTGNAVSRVLTVPATKRAFIVWNAGSAVLTVTVSGGGSTTVAAGKMRFLHSTGSALTVYAESDRSVAAFTALSDVPAAYTGGTLKRLRVNAGATAIEHHTAGAERPAQIDKATEYTTTTPAAPLIGLTGFIQKRAFRKSVAFIDPASHVRSVETALFRKGAQYMVGAPPTTVTPAGLTLTNYAFGFAGGAASPTVTNVAQTSERTFYALQTSKTRVASSIGTNAQCRWVDPELAFARTGGFFCAFRFGIAGVQSDAKYFVGLGTDTGALTSNWASNQTTLGGSIGLLKDAGDDTWHVLQKIAGSTSFTKTDTTFLANTQESDFFELRLNCEPAGVPYYSVERLSTGDVFEGQFVNDATLVGTTALLYPALRGQSSTVVSAAVKIDISRLYFENEVSVI